MYNLSKYARILEHSGYEFRYQMLQVHDRAQVLISCSSERNAGRPTFVGTIERWSTRRLNLPKINCVSSISLFILVLNMLLCFSFHCSKNTARFQNTCNLFTFTCSQVENMGGLNYGSYIFDRKVSISRRNHNFA